MKILFVLIVMVLLFGAPATPTKATERPVAKVDLQDTLLRLKKESLLQDVHNANKNLELQVVALKAYKNQILKSNP